MAEQRKLIIQPKKYREATAVVSARLPKDLIADLDSAASETGYNRNEIIALCLEYALENMEKGEKS